jgi:hypothetical protein
MTENPVKSAPTWDVFIAYPNGSWNDAESLFTALQPDLSVFLDKKSLQTGTQYDLAIPEAQRSSRMTVVLVNATYLAAFYARAEAAAAIALSRTAPGAHMVVPIYMNGLPKAHETPYGFQLLQSLDFQKELGWEAIAQKLRGMLNLPANHGQPQAITEQTPADPKVALILRLPIGPRFEMLRVRPNIIDEYARAARGDTAASVVNEAAYLQISANPEATYILPYNLPDPHDVAALTYWRSAFAEACLHGPRMVGALLLALDDNMFPAGVQSERQQLLATLARWK